AWCYVRHRDRFEPYLCESMNLRHSHSRIWPCFTPLFIFESPPPPQ
uniref:Uncharacterized protein n=1 Tax=Otolemur garnettii TaxID=30611 RepID=H0XPW1_OTOGA